MATSLRAERPRGSFPGARTTSLTAIVARVAALHVCVTIAFSAGCRTGCSEDGAGEIPSAGLELVLRGLLPTDASAETIDLDDQGGSLLVAGMVGPIQVWAGTAPAGSTVPAGRGSAPAGSESTQPTATWGIQEALATARFVEGGTTVFAATEQGLLTIWDWRQRQMVWSHQLGGRSRHAAISDDARFVAFGGAVLDRRTGHEIGRRAAIATQTALSFSANGQHVVAAGFQDPWIAVRDLPDGTLREWIAGNVHAATLSPHGDLVAAIVRGGDVRLWRQPSGEAAGSWSGDPESRHVRFTPDGRRLVVSEDKGVSVYDVASGRRSARGRIVGAGRLWAFATDGELAAAGTTGGALVLWHLARGDVLATAQVSTTPIVAIDISVPRKLLAAADQAGQITVWRWHRASSP
jgi:WD40 repeat protein